MTVYTGNCHCGAISCRYSTALPLTDWSVHACQCTFCRLHDVVTTSDTNGSLAFVATVADDLRRYRFGLKTADFLLCRTCGVYLGARIDTNSGSFGIVNLRTMPIPRNDLAIAKRISYANENAAERVSRRQRHWTPVD